MLKRFDAYIGVYTVLLRIRKYKLHRECVLTNIRRSSRLSRVSSGLSLISLHRLPDKSKVTANDDGRQGDQQDTAHHGREGDKFADERCRHHIAISRRRDRDHDIPECCWDTVKCARIIVGIHEHLPRIIPLAYNIKDDMYKP